MPRPFLPALGALLVSAAALALGTGAGSSNAPTAASKPCSRGAVPARIAGKHVCLRLGQRCKRRLDRQYHRYGFHCHATGRLTKPRPTQQKRSTYVSLASDQPVNERSVLLTAEFVLARPDSIFVEADGTYAPTSAEAAATVYAQIDGQRVTNRSTIDWRGSVDPVRHSFDAVGAAAISSGQHHVELVAEPLAGTFTVGASSNLSVLVHPAQRVAMAQRESEAGPFDYTTLGRLGPDLPHDPLVAIAADARNPTVALASATTRRAAHDGDAMLGIYLDGRHPGPASSLWTVNDTCSCAEVEGPLFTQALLSGGARNSSVSLDATEFPWSLPPPAREDPAVYVVPPSATLVVLGGDMGIRGRGSSLLPSFPDTVGTVSDFSCVGSSSGWPGCPAVSTDVLLAEETLRVPATHSGVIMFAAKTRVQGAPEDEGGTVQLWLTVDGARRGSVGVQQLAAPFAVSQRTIAASYLAAGSNRLRPGPHVVRVYGRADGSFIHLVLLRDIPLVWFD